MSHRVSTTLSALQAHGWAVLRNARGLGPPDLPDVLGRWDAWFVTWHHGDGFVVDGQPWSLTLFGPGHDADPSFRWVRHVAWDRSADESLVHNDVRRARDSVVFDPTMTVSDFTVEAGPIDVLYEALVAAVPAALVPPEAVIDDAGSGGFEVRRRRGNGCAVSYEGSWMGEPNAPFAEHDRLVRRLAAEMERASPVSRRGVLRGSPTAPHPPPPPLSGTTPDRGYHGG